jgi:serine/threonine protein kinase
MASDSAVPKRTISTCNQPQDQTYEDPETYEMLARMLVPGTRITGAGSTLAPLLAFGIGGRYSVMADDCGGQQLGSFGFVYRAKDVQSGEAVAVKVFYKTTNERLLDAFAKEVDAATKISSRLRSEYCVGVRAVLLDAPMQQHDARGADTGYSVTAIVMDWASHRDLFSRVQAAGQQPAHEAYRNALQLARAVRDMHQAGMVHRDIKPENVVLARDRSVRLCDFGTAVDVQELRQRRPVKRRDVSGGTGILRRSRRLGASTFFDAANENARPVNARTLGDESSCSSSAAVRTGEDPSAGACDYLMLDVSSGPCTCYVAPEAWASTTSNLSPERNAAAAKMRAAWPRPRPRPLAPALAAESKASGCGGDGGDDGVPLLEDGMQSMGDSPMELAAALEAADVFSVAASAFFLMAYSAISLRAQQAIEEPFITEIDNMSIFRSEKEGEGGWEFGLLLREKGEGEGKGGVVGAAAGGVRRPPMRLWRYWRQYGLQLPAETEELLEHGLEADYRHRIGVKGLITGLEALQVNAETQRPAQEPYHEIQEHWWQSFGSPMPYPL